MNRRLLGGLIIPAERPTSVGEMLCEEFMEPMGITQIHLAESTGLDAVVVNDLCCGQRRVTIGIACRLARALGTSPIFWIRLQLINDVWEERNGDVSSAP